MGPGFNMVLAFLVLFVSCLMFSCSVTTLVMDEIDSSYPAYTAGLREGDTLLEVNGKKVSTWTQARLEMSTLKEGAKVKFKVKKQDGSIIDMNIKPKKEVNEDGEVSYIYGISSKLEEYNGFVGSVKYAFIETKNTILSMGTTLKFLFTGNLSVNDLSGPVGIYEVVDQQAENGIKDLLYLMAYLSINVGIMNLIPFPAFDGGHILFLIIEKIRRKPVSQNVEATITGIGFICLLLLMVYVTIHDVFNLLT